MIKLIRNLQWPRWYNEAHNKIQMIELNKFNCSRNFKLKFMSVIDALCTIA